MPNPVHVLLRHMQLCKCTAPWQIATEVKDNPNGNRKSCSD
jgi:hypothetical protein